MTGLVCPRCRQSLERVADGQYQCPKGHRWLDDTPEPVDTQRPDGVSLSYVPGQRKSSSKRGKSAAREKQKAYFRRTLPGANARMIRTDTKKKPP